MCSEFQTITPMSVQNSICICKVFQIKFSDGLVCSLRSRQKVNAYSARVFKGAQVFNRFEAHRVPNNNFNKCTK